MNVRKYFVNLSLALALLLVSGVGMLTAADKTIVQTAVDAGSFKTLATALTKADLVDALQGKGPFTVFAPTDEAFAKLPKETLETLLKPENKAILTSILTYHVVPGRYLSDQLTKKSTIGTLEGQQLDLKLEGSTLFVDKSKVVKADIAASNGVIHVIDQVMLPSTDDIVATAVQAGNFQTLAAALKAAGLVEALQGKGPFTVFAPTDKAFAKLPKSTLETLLKPENKDQLVAILKYHVVPGRSFSQDVVKLRSVKTLLGKAVQIRNKDDGVYLNDSKLIATDIDASNGVIHVIDSVLLPPKTSQTSTSRQKLVHTINQASRQYNHGNHHACMTMYMELAGTLLNSHSDMMPSKVQSRLRHAYQMGGSNHYTVSDRAWILRHALDGVLDVMPPAQ